MKSVQIPEDLFCDLFLYHVIGIDEPGARIKAALEQKMEALKRHDLYTSTGLPKTKPTARKRVSSIWTVPES